MKIRLPMMALLNMLFIRSRAGTYPQPAPLKMKKTQRYERRLAAAREDCIGVMQTYKAEIEKERTRMNASHNGFVRTCCQQTIDQLTAEKRAIEEAVVG